MSDPICKSYVYHEGKCWFVSTINRESSAAYGGPHMYHETLVWAWDTQKRERASDSILFHGEGHGCHIEVVQQLMRDGTFPARD